MDDYQRAVTVQEKMTVKTGSIYSALTPAEKKSAKNHFLIKTDHKIISHYDYLLDGWLPESRQLPREDDSEDGVYLFRSDPRGEEVCRKPFPG